MNPKFKELALQSGMIYPAMGEKSYTNFCHEKFAELIIEQCGGIGDSYVEGDRRIYPSDEMKKYFGIE